MLTRFNLNELMPFILLWIPWVLAIRELHSHFRYGRMTEYLRRGADPVDDQPATRTTTPAQNPISYRLLLVFYLVVAILVPALTAYVLYTSSGASTALTQWKRQLV